MTKNVEYNIGLDIGTTSIGWAVTNQNSQLLKKGNHPLWGFNIFPEAETAVNRRVARGARRRVTRKKQRIKLLQDLCGEMIYEKDPMFFKRLKYSYLVPEDREEDYLKTDSIILTGDLNDRDFYNDYPTIYHLRDKLASSKEKMDPRLVYLAMHHIVKYRGNFLYEAQGTTLNVNELSLTVKTIEDIILYISEYTENDISSIDASNLLNIILDKRLSGRDRNKKCVELINDKEAKKVVKELVNAFLGYKFNPGVIFKADYDKTIKYSDSDIEDKKNEIEPILGEFYDTFLMIEEVFNFYLLKDILSNSSKMTISDSMINIYDKHKHDLELLKYVFSKSKKDVRDSIFKDGGLYDKYINDVKNMDIDKFYKELKVELNKLQNSASVQKILEDIEEQNFLPKQNTSKNVAIPYQLHYAELVKIIENQSEYYPCLKKNKDKILSLVSFRIPYYVGPLVNYDDRYSWIVRNDDSKQPIRPWNINELVNIEETAKKFIDRMRNHCTYILAEETLPKNSILLSRFNLLDELNKIKIDNAFCFTKYEDKMKVINTLFLTKNEVKENDLLKWLIDNQYITNDKCALTGFRGDKKFLSSLKSEIKFRSIFKDDFDLRIDDIELIIEYLTVYNSKDIVEKRLTREMPYLTKEQLNSILSLTYSGYGRMSKKLINGLVSRNQKGYVGTIYEIMERTNLNFMQVVNESSFGFMDIIMDENGNSDNTKGISYSSVEELPGSPSLKRGIWQTVKVVEDIVKYMKRDPKNIYIEFAREEGIKKRSTSRYAAIEKIFKEYLPKSDIYAELKKYTKEQLSDDRLFLYFMQMGKCLYSGKKLKIHKLSSYQIDHILPQCYTKDDSLENRALVIASENQKKADSLLLSESIIQNRRGFWKHLLDIGLMGDKKYKNLTRTIITENEQVGFIARQLVETRQMSVHVKNLMKDFYKDTEVVTVHAPLSSEFRRKFKLYKIRELNNSHHAQDAYLASVIGQFISKKFPWFSNAGKLEYRYIEKDIKEKLKEYLKTKGAINDYKAMYSFIISQMRHKNLIDKETGEPYWNGSQQIQDIKQIFESKKYFFNYAVKEDDGKLYNATLYKRGSKEAKINIKNDKPVEKYGGYNSLEKAYGLAVEFKKGKKTVRKVISIPIIQKLSGESLENYVSRTEEGKDVKILEKILKGQTFIVDNCMYSMSSPEEWQLREQIFVSRKTKKTLSEIYKNKKEIESVDICDAYFEVLNKTYQFVPSLRSKINDGFGKFNEIAKGVFEESEDIKDSKEKFMLLSLEQQKESTKLLVKALTNKGGIKLKFGDALISSSYNRYNEKTIYLDDVLFVYTSPSGIYKSIKKL